MRVAIATDWFAPRRGGVESQLFQLAERLGECGHEVDVLTSTPHAVADNVSRFRVCPLEVSTLPGADVAISPFLPAVLRSALSRGYDVVHAHVSVVSPVGYTAAVVGRSLELPTVVTFHSVLRHKVRLLRALNSVLGFSRSAVAWTAVSELVAGQVRRALSLETDSVSVLANGIDLAYWRSNPGGSGTLRSRTAVTFVSVMRLHRKKRPRALVRAFARAATITAEPMRLLIAGSGPEVAAVQGEIDALGVREGRARAELIGWRDPAALAQLFADADAFVMPSTRESFGIAALEARAVGLPVIAMRTSGSMEFLSPGVDSLVCDDDSALASAIARMAGDRSLRERLAAARPDLERYDWSATLSSHEAAYERATMLARARAGVAAVPA